MPTSSNQSSIILIENHNDIVLSDLTIRDADEHGIYALQSDNLQIINCDIYDNSGDGINLYNFGNVELTNNLVYSNSFEGAQLIGITSGAIDGCEFNDNYQSGILIDSTTNLQITSSEFYYNDYGINIVDFSDSNTISYCDFVYNNNGLSIASFCDNNLVFLNSFFGNTQNAESYASNSWDDGLVGNYWDDYTGFDSDSDGIGDTPYPIPGGSNQDNYPLIHYYGSVINQDTDEIFLTIQAAIDDADTVFGHTIFVYEDTYYENIVVNKDGIT